MKKKYLKNIDDILKRSFGDYCVYYRKLKNIKDEVYCLEDYHVVQSINGILKSKLVFVKNKKYKIKKTYKAIFVDSEGYVMFENFYVDIFSEFKLNYFNSEIINEYEIYEHNNKLDYGKHILTEKTRTKKDEIQKIL